jgi:hypothetical protein
VRVGSEGQTTGWEEISIFNISQMRSGGPAYADCFHTPYRASLFNWLFYQAYALVARALEPGEWNLPTPLRFFSAGWAALGALAMLSLLQAGRPVGAPAGTRALSLINGALAFTTWFGPTLGWWTVTVRPDVAAVSCEMLALAVIARKPVAASATRGLATGLLFYLGWSFKQSAVGMLLGTILGLALCRNWRAAAAVLGVFAGLVLVTFALADSNYWNNVLVAPGVAPWKRAQLRENAVSFLASWGFLLFLAIPWLMRLGRDPEQHDEEGGRPTWFLALVFLMTALIGLVASARVGSIRNYYFSAWVVGMALLGTLQNKILTAGAGSNLGRLRRVLFAAPYSLALVLCVGYTVAVFFLGPEWGRIRIFQVGYSADLLDAVSQSKKPVFIQDPSLARLALGEEAKGTPVLDETIYWDAVQAGLIQDGGVGKGIESHYYRTLWLYVPPPSGDTAPGRWTWERWRDRAQAAGYIPTERRGSFTKYVSADPGFARR